MRINKFLSDSGLGSRRKVEDLVSGGRVKVNGEMITNLATDINPETDIVTLDGERVQNITEKYYFVLNKPKGYITSLSDDKGRKTVMEFVPLGYKKLVVPVGRLDYDSEGLLIFTNDGEYNQKMTHPKNNIPKKYIVKIEGSLDREQLETLRNGVYIDNKKTRPSKVAVVESNQKGSRIEVTITEGKNRQVRRMFEAVGKYIKLLKRVQIGELRLGGLSRGEIKLISKKDAQKALTLPR